jgi:hypothetical protein
VSSCRTCKNDRKQRLDYPSLAPSSRNVRNPAFSLKKPARNEGSATDSIVSSCHLASCRFWKDVVRTLRWGQQSSSTGEPRKRAGPRKWRKEERFGHDRQDRFEIPFTKDSPAWIGLALSIVLRYSVGENEGDRPGAPNPRGTALPHPQISARHGYHGLQGRPSAQHRRTMLALRGLPRGDEATIATLAQRVSPRSQRGRTDGRTGVWLRCRCDGAANGCSSKP